MTAKLSATQADLLELLKGNDRYELRIGSQWKRPYAYVYDKKLASWYDWPVLASTALALERKGYIEKTEKDSLTGDVRFCLKGEA